MSIAVKNYAYTSRNDSGKIIKGKVEAPSEAAALTKIRGLGLSARHRRGVERRHRPADARSRSRASRRASTSRRSRS